MSLRKLEELIFTKSLGNLPQIRLQISDKLSHLLHVTILAREQIININSSSPFQIKKNTEVITTKYIKQVKEASTDNLLSDLLILSMDYYCLFMGLSDMEVNQERRLAKELQKLVMNPSFVKQSFWDSIKGSLLFSCSYLELAFKSIITNKMSNPLQFLKNLEKRLKQVAVSFQIAQLFCKKLLALVCHLKIYYLNASIGINNKLTDIFHVLISDYQVKMKLLTLDCKIMLLYNCLKTLLGLKQLSREEADTLYRFYQSIGVRKVKTYDQHVLHCFFIIKGLIFEKGKAMERGQNIDDEEQNIQYNPTLYEKLGCWLNVNLEQVWLSVEEVNRNIIRHRVASLATLIGLKFDIPGFCLNFLQLMHDGPFNNDAQAIKLCFELFQARQYQKLHNCLQVLLSAASCKNLRERQVLLSMCAIFTGLYLGNREQALLYAKLNHTENKSLILREETLLAQVGFAYYNLAIHEIYTCNRQNFISQALIALLASLKRNPNNYLVQYCVGKIYLMQFDYDSAYRHAMQSCKSGRGQWMPFSLLSCVYYCQRKVSKASVVIDELLKKYPYAKFLYYIRAYLEANRILLDVEYDEEVQAARQLGQDIYQLCRQKVLQNKPLTNLVKYCQEYHQMCVGQITVGLDQNYFNVLITGSQPSMNESFREGAGYQEERGQQALLRIIPLFLEVGLLTLTEGLLKMLPSSALREYYRALLHQLKKEIPQSCQQYRSILKQQPYHTHTLINLALTEENPSEGLHYIDLAEKFVKNGKLWTAKGVILSKLGRIQQATQLLLKEGEEGWLECQPDLLYYY